MLSFDATSTEAVFTVWLSHDSIANAATMPMMQSDICSQNRFNNVRNTFFMFISVLMLFNYVLMVFAECDGDVLFVIPHFHNHRNDNLCGIVAGGGDYAQLWN